MVWNKKGGFKTIAIVFLIFAVFIIAIMSGIFNWGAQIFDETFSGVDVNLGNQSFNQTYQDTLKKGLDPIINNGDLYGILMLFGMVIVMLVLSYSIPEKNRVWIISEIFVLFVAFIIAVTISRAYNTAINASSTLLNIYSVDLIKTSKFILNLPVITVVTWAFMVVLSYSNIRKKSEISSTGQFGDLGA